MDPETLARLPVLEAAPSTPCSAAASSSRRFFRRSSSPGATARACSRSSTATACAQILRRVLDETQFLSDYGIRSLSREHDERPYRLQRRRSSTTRSPICRGCPTTAMFGGNSNWRGPIWFPMNFLLIQAIATCARYYDDSFTIECPTGSGRYLTLAESRRRARRSADAHLRSRRRQRSAVAPSSATTTHFQHDPHWRDYVPFHEFFHGDTRRRAGRQPPDRMDRAGRAADSVRRPTDVRPLVDERVARRTSLERCWRWRDGCRRQRMRSCSSARRAISPTRRFFPHSTAWRRHGHLTMPVVAVAKSGWTLDQLRARARGERRASRRARSRGVRHADALAQPTSTATTAMPTTFARTARTPLGPSEPPGALPGHSAEALRPRVRAARPHAEPHATAASSSRSRSVRDCTPRRR